MECGVSSTILLDSRHPTGFVMRNVANFSSGTRIVRKTRNSWPDPIQKNRESTRHEFALEWEILETRTATRHATKSAVQREGEGTNTSLLEKVPNLNKAGATHPLTGCLNHWQGKACYVTRKPNT